MVVNHALYCLQFWRIYDMANEFDKTMVRKDIKYLQIFKQRFKLEDNFYSFQTINRQRFRLFMRLSTSFRSDCELLLLLVLIFSRNFHDWFRQFLIWILCKRHFRGGFCFSLKITQNNSSQSRSKIIN